MLLVSIEQVVLAALLFACLASFAWGMLSFFERPAQRTRGMRFAKFSGLFFAVLHLAAILTSRSFSTSNVVRGSLLYLVSLGLYWWAIRCHGSKRLSAIDSPNTPEHLVDYGPYRFIRHPFYTSYLLSWVAGAVACNQWWLVPTVVVMLGIYLHAARYEEGKFSATPLANAYSLYRAHTGLFLPNPLKLFRWELKRGTFNAARVE